MDHEVLYTTELTFLCYGLPVWEPDPKGLYNRVKIGDVGYVEDGKFIPLFNILPPSLSNPDRPFIFAQHTFRPLQLPSDVPTTHQTNPLIPSVYARQDVMTFSASMTVDSTGPVAGGSFSLSFTKEKGAALVLPFTARREDTLYKKKFKDHMLANYRQWYRFAVDECARDIKLHQLILITGCDLTRQWATATYDRSSLGIAGALGAQVPATVEASFSLSAGWRTVQPVRTRQGPEETEHTDMEESLNNQCLFLRGFYVKERFLVGPKVLKAGAGYHDPGNYGPEEESTGGVLTDDDVTINSLSPSTHENLITVLLDYMLEESNADVVIVHDSDLWPYLGLQENLEDLHRTLKSMRPTIEVEDGVGSLVAESEANIPPNDVRLHDADHDMGDSLRPSAGSDSGISKATSIPGLAHQAERQFLENPPERRRTRPSIVSGSRKEPTAQKNSAVVTTGKLFSNSRITPIAVYGRQFTEFKGGMHGSMTGSSATETISRLFKLIGTVIFEIPRDSRILGALLSRMYSVYDGILILIKKVDHDADLDWISYDKYTTAIPHLERLLVEILNWYSNDKPRGYLPPGNTITNCIFHMTTWKNDRDFLKQISADLEDKSFQVILQEGQTFSCVLERTEDDLATLQALRGFLLMSTLSDKHVEHDADKSTVEKLRTSAIQLGAKFSQIQPAEAQMEIIIRTLMYISIPFALITSANRKQKAKLRRVALWDEMNRMMVQVLDYIEGSGHPSISTDDLEQAFSDIEQLLLDQEETSVSNLSDTDTVAFLDDLDPSNFDPTKPLMTAMLRLTPLVQRKYYSRCVVLVRTLHFLYRWSTKPEIAADDAYRYDCHELGETVAEALEALRAMKSDNASLSGILLGFLGPGQTPADLDTLFERTKTLFSSFKLENEWPAYDEAYQNAQQSDEASLQEITASALL